MVGCVAVIIGAIIQASSYSVAQIIVGRLVVGKFFVFFLLQHYLKLLFQQVSVSVTLVLPYLLTWLRLVLVWIPEARLVL